MNWHKKLTSPRDLQRSLPLQHAVSVSTQQNIPSHYTSTLVTFGKLYTDSVAKTTLTFCPYIRGYNNGMPIPATARPKALFCGRSLPRTVGSNPAGVWIFFSCDCCVLSGRGLCVGMITSLEESYRMWGVQWLWLRSPVGETMTPNGVKVPKKKISSSSSSSSSSSNNNNKLQ